ncbi:NAD(P)H-dependent oxidoreductase [Oceanicaulis sp. MMSF_3324]|uniref:NAD(P)H-dependent oxidoreductase n=1 Tax=Oceanicaulis sp. MMSF_3324 TaxID=3046702 RepID=UPI00273E96DD|nr:NAD(P)H-dependent oxidoreductase [Oceanicaulis sp. MMSF_3324]
MPKRICLINGHPDPSPERFCHALTDAYQTGAQEAGHIVDRFDVGAIEFGFLSSPQDFETPPPAAFEPVRTAMAEADHLVLIYPLWLGEIPAKTKAFFEHAASGEFFLATSANGAGWPAQRMKGKSARLILTMGMPGFAYRLLFGAHSVKALVAGLLKISGFKPVRHTVFGGVQVSEKARARMLERTQALGQAAR